MEDTPPAIQSSPSPQAAAVAPARTTPPPYQERTFGDLLRHGGELLVGVLFNPWITFLCLIGLILGGFVFPPQGPTPPNCSMLVGSGVPCPSCGLTRSTSSVLQGEFRGAWQYNPLGFVVAALFALLGPITLMPGTWRRALERAVRPAAGWLFVLTVAILLALLVHGVGRIVLIRAGDPALQWWVNGTNPPAMVHRPNPNPVGLNFPARPSFAWLLSFGASEDGASDEGANTHSEQEEL